jgi:four helix bundle protein
MLERLTVYPDVAGHTTPIILVLCRDIDELPPTCREGLGPSKRFPVEERYSLTDQVRRSSRSVCANIAEGWRKRRYSAAFVSKLSDADAEATETQVWLDIALNRGYLDTDTHRLLLNGYDLICAQLFKMMSTADQWTTGQERNPTTRS